MVCECVEWIQLIQDNVQSWDFLNTMVSIY